MWLYGQESIKVSYHHAMFGGHRHSGSETPCLSAPAESTPESSLVKIWPVKLLPTEKNWIVHLSDAYNIV